MQAIFDFIYQDGDLLRSACAIICLALAFELIFGVISIISHAVKGGR